MNIKRKYSYVKKYKFLLSFLLGVLIFASCNPSMQAFKKGNYYDATIKAVKILRNNPSSKNALETIKKSYPMELDYEKQLIQQLTMSNHPDKYYNIAETYLRLNQLADEITRCPAALEVLKPLVYFHSQLKTAEELASKEQFAAAKDLMNNGNYMNAREAIKRLEWVNERNPAFPELAKTILEARELATLKTMVILKPELKENYDINSSVFYMALFDFLDHNCKTDFSRFYQPEQARKMGIVTNETLSVQVLEFRVGTLLEKETETSYESDSIVVGKVTGTDGNEYNAYGIVKAKVRTFEQELPVYAIVEIMVSDNNTKEILTSEKFAAEYHWKNQWAMYNGDERAVPESVLKLTKRKQQNPPPPQEMFLLVSDPIIIDASKYLKNYYKRR